MRVIIIRLATAAALPVFVYFAIFLKSTKFAGHTQRSSAHQDQCDYVGFEFGLWHRTGNYLFFFSAVTYIAWLTGRHPCVWTSKSRQAILLDRVFRIDIPRFDARTVGCPLHRFTQKGAGVYDRRVESLTSVSHNRSLVVKGVFQSWKYVTPVAEKLRQQLVFRRELTAFVGEFFSTHVPANWTSMRFVRVGVHVRRGDFLLHKHRVRGFSTVNERYLRRAMNYFVERFPRVQFIVASDDIPWCKKYINVSMYNSTNVNVTFSVKHNTGQDLALLASCNHTIMSSGSFSWWAAWFANGIAVYYADYPRNGSVQRSRFNVEDYYRPDWIGMVG